VRSFVLKGADGSSLGGEACGLLKALLLGFGFMRLMPHAAYRPSHKCLGKVFPGAEGVVSAK